MNSKEDNQFFEQYKKEVFNTYKKTFSGIIKESFLVQMFDMVQNDPRYIADFMKNPARTLPSFDSMVRGNAYSPFELCKMIVMSHYINTVSLSDNERGKMQNNSEYQKKLTTDVIKMYFVRDFTLFDFNNTSFETFLPIIYYISVINNYCANKQYELSNNGVLAKNSYHTDFNNRIIYKLLMKIKACISLADARALDELMVIYRTLIELFMVYCVLWDQDDETINEFAVFNDLAFSFNYGEEIPETVKKKAKESRTKEVKYINYDWIEKLNDYQYLPNKDKKIGLNAIALILDKKYGNLITNFGTELYKFYRACNPQTHVTMKVMNFFELELHIFQNIAVMLKTLCNTMLKQLFDINFEFGNLNLLDELNNALNDSRKVYDWLCLNLDNEEKTNLDYQKRAICSMKMRK